ncbi:MAG: AMP-binding protein [Burkholderiales bacterium]|nr:MAG: AMP-binding protein [Burkholderiales bacterium]
MDGFVTWPAEFAARYRAAGHWQDRTLGEVLAEAFAAHADRTALVADDGRSFTYKRLDRLSQRLALHLRALGLALYDRVVLHLPNTPEAVIAFLGIVRAGGIPIMALPPHREAEIGHFARHAEATCYVVGDRLRDIDGQALAQAVAQDCPSLRLVLVGGGEPRKGFRGIAALLEDPIEERIAADVLPRPDPSLPALLLLSGGTTGVPKLIPRTHNDYAVNFLRCAEVCGLGADTVLLIAIPQGHNFALGCPGLLGTLSRGGRELLLSSPAPDHVIEMMQRHRVTHFVGVPTMVLGLLDHPRRKSHDLSALRTVITGGSKLNPEVGMRVRRELGCDLQQVLGMAEGPLFYTRLDDPEEVKIETQGRLILPDDEFRIVDPDSGAEVEPGAVGELWCRGPYTIRGYYRAAEHNAKAFSADGFYKSGDLARLHPSGNVVVDGRIKDCINRGGEKISSEEVENHMLAHPAVANCALVAMPDARLGEKGCAWVVLRPGASLTLESLTKFLSDERRIARFKLPERLEITEALPLTNVGKVDKKALRDITATLAARD